MPPKAEIATDTPPSDILADLRAAYAERDRLAAVLPRDQKAIEIQDAAVMTLVLAYTHAERFDPVEEPALAALATAAASKNPLAVRLLLQPRVELSLYQRPESEKPLPDEEVTINSVRIPLPRGIDYQIPLTVKEILKQSKVK